MAPVNIFHDYEHNYDYEFFKTAALFFDWQIFRISNICISNIRIQKIDGAVKKSKH